MRQHRGEEGVSEVIGVMLLVGVTVLAVAIVAVALLSGPQPGEIPHATIVAGNESGRLALVHEGGDPLRAGEYRIYVENESGFVDGTGDFTEPAGGVWSIGGNITYNGTETLKRVVVTTVSGGSETILAEPEFVGGGEGAAGFSPDPVEPGVTPAPTSDSIVTILFPEGDEGIPKDANAEIQAKITSDEAEYVHMILYNYKKLSGGHGVQGGKIEARNMTRTKIEEIFTTGVFSTNNLGEPGDLIAVMVIAYDENNVPIASLAEMAIMQ